MISEKTGLEIFGTVVSEAGVLSAILLFICVITF